MLNDELISAYLDGELDAERRALVERQLRTDKGAAARLERLRAADNVLKQAFPVTEKPKDDLLAAAILAGDVHMKSRWATRVAAIAAAIALGLVVGQFVRVSDSESASFAISEQQARLLNTQLSGRVTNTQEGAFEVVLSLRADDGEVCRQFRLTRDMQSTDVLACRTEGDSWRMLAAVSAVVTESYVPASVRTPLDAAIESLGTVEALDLSQERAQIAHRWH